MFRLAGTRDEDPPISYYLVQGSDVMTWQTPEDGATFVWLDGGPLEVWIFLFYTFVPLINVHGVFEIKIHFFFTRRKRIIILIKFS